MNTDLLTVKRGSEQGDAGGAVVATNNGLHCCRPSPQWAEPFCLTDMGERSDERIRELHCSVQFTVYTVSYTSPLLQMGGRGPPRAEGAPQTSEEGG